MAHSKRQEDKIRKSGRYLQNKSTDLGQHCGIFSALILEPDASEDGDGDASAARPDIAGREQTGLCSRRCSPHRPGADSNS